MEEKDATYGGMQFKTLFKKILGRSIENMRGMKGCIDTRFFIWKQLCYYLNIGL
jgi:hypothetical protein